jgi:hypothetical protein
MNGKILFYSILAALWLALALGFWFGLHERFIGAREEWQRNLVVGLSLLMMLFNLLRIYLIRQRQRARKQP